MRLIDKVEISYLRSLYRATADNFGDMNVIFGRNDSGKSNLLRALNLFFKDEVEPDLEIDFDVDFSDIRRSEAKSAKGRQFVAIRVDFNIPTNFRNSLGARISLKRQWNIDGEMTETLPKELSTGAKIQLTKFLNQIDFTYIPAIKDLNVFGDLIQRMYDAASQSSGLQSATSAFVDAIRSQTGGLSDNLSKIFSSKTQLAAPTEMGLLFRSLDFSHGDDAHSLLRQKGDGIKARHLPELLKYINANEANKKFFLWGFEEPENSLDFGAAEAEAKNFASISAQKDTQVFITSHSPAFYLASAESRGHSIRRFFVSKQSSPELGRVLPLNAVSAIDKLDDAETHMKEASLLQLPYLIRKWKEIRDESNALVEEMTALKRQIELLQTPTLFVEGKTDKMLFEKSIRTIGGESLNVEVRLLDGTPKSTSELLIKLAPVGGLNKAPVLFLFDNDHAGRAAYNNICKQKVPGAEPSRVADNVFVWALPPTDEAKLFFKNFGIQSEQQKFVSEFLFPGDAAADLCKRMMSAQAITESKSVILDEYHKSLSQTNAQKLREAEVGSTEWFWSRGLPDNLKTRFFKSAISEFGSSVADIVSSSIIKSITT